MRQRAVRQQRVDRDARCRAWCRSAANGRRRNCCRPCRRWWRATRSRYRPETTARAALSCRLRSSSTMPGSTVQRRPLTSRSRMRVRYFEQSTTSESPTVCPHCDVPPPRASTVTPLGPGNLYRPFGFFYRARGHHADRHDLVMRGVGGVAAAGEAVEMHVPAQFGLQPPLQAGHYHRHGVDPFRAQSLLCMKGLFGRAENRLTAMLHS